MDSSWIELPNDHPSYINGCVKFIDFAKEAPVNGKIRCPCKRCKVEKWFSIDTVQGHILFNGFYPGYKNWIFHGKEDLLDHTYGFDVGNSSQGSLHNKTQGVGKDDMGGLFKAALGMSIPQSSQCPDELANNQNSEGEVHHDSFPDSFSHESNDQSTTFNINDPEEAKYKTLLEASNKELYAGCKKFSKLSFLLHLFHLKCMNHWSVESFNMLLKLLLEAFPHIMDFPSSYYESKKMIKDLGLGYEKIDACPNNCILYWGELAEKEECHICQTSRWKMVKGNECDITDKNKTTRKRGEPAKVMRYFPLIPRLKRIYMTSETAKDMRYHANREVDGLLKHPADGSAWKDLGDLDPEFGADPRSVRLGLASDGFNPYRLMNTTYSTWPVVLIPYNLPPWICMKPSSFILSIIIPGKSGPGNDIDVYLQPLVHELKILWEGVQAFDAYSGEYFKMRAGLYCTINDFPAYAMLSGWSTKGYKACPSCTDSTPSYRFGGKICYVGHRKWLPVDHPYRSEASKFDGTEEHGKAPVSATASQILREQEEVDYVYGKTKKTRKLSPKKRQRKGQGDSNEGEGGENSKKKVTWTKRSVFFDLPYWKHNRLRHNLDVMHIEKNVCDNILGTLLDMDKSRDDENARKAIKELGVKSHLWLQDLPNGTSYMPPASFTMSNEEKERFLRVLAKLKVPDGYSSNLSRCVNMKQRKLINLKSHDNHVLMQDILPVALRASKATKVTELLSDLSSFFKYICSTEIDPKKLDEYQYRIILTLCEMEKEFLPTFFTIMVHLIIHLVDEVKLGGPVHYRWMYPIERYLAHLKSDVTNKAQPEGSIAEGYVLEETITFCSRFLDGVKTIFNKPKRIDDDIPQFGNYLCNSGGRATGKEENICLDEKTLKQAHRYVLLHSDEMKGLREGFLDQKRQENLIIEIDVNVESGWIINEFSEWLQNQVHHIDASTKEGTLRRALAGGPNCFGRRMKSYSIGGYKFNTMERDRYRTTQNCGILVDGEDGEVYYGKLKDILELDYFGDCKVVLFHCDWVDIQRGVKSYPNGGACVNFSKLMHTGRNLRDDPFVFSSQAKQVFYVEDEKKKRMASRYQN